MNSETIISELGNGTKESQKAGTLSMSSMANNYRKYIEDGEMYCVDESYVE